jgi:hypothetical protein
MHAIDASCAFPMVDTNGLSSGMTATFARRKPLSMIHGYPRKTEHQRMVSWASARQKVPGA